MTIPVHPKAPSPALDNAQALSGKQQVIELADGLSACADELHARIVAEIRSVDGRAVSSKVQDAMRAMLDDEMLLRQHANGLYADAASFVIEGLERPQGQLLALTADAANKIRRIGVIGETAGLVGGLLSLAGAAMAGQPAAVALAMDKILLHAATLDTLAPPTAPA